MLHGALCGPKQGQTSQRERTGFLGLPRKDMTETFRTGSQGWGSLGPEANLGVVPRSRGSPLILAWGCGLYIQEKL